MIITHLLVGIVARLVFATEIHVQNETYRKAKGEIQLNFTRVHLGSARSKIQCFTKCSGDSGCLGVRVQKTNEGMFRCSQMKEDSAGTSVSAEELVYLKGTGDGISDDPDYWYYDYPKHNYGDCIQMYAEYYSLTLRTCDGELPYYWYYDVLDHKWGDCIQMYAEEYGLALRTCDGELPYVCEIH